MTFSSVSARRRLRGFVLYRGSGKNSAPSVAPVRPFEGGVKPSAPRLSGPYEKRVA
ncbi:MAG: hypothetical protein FWE35_11645 [Streptosporangiales bacterium]|nr:hypothetical protein [Streptosporangiales bacterium]